MKKTDTSLWLHNKLGNVNDLWSAGSICSQLNNEKLKNIRDCFTDLQPLVKLKLLISFLHIPRRNVDEWKNELKNIIEVAILDSDQWVSMVGELLKIFPQKGTINFAIEENSAVFNDLINELKKLVKKHNDQGILPIECLYLNKSALNSIISNVPAATKHFNLKKNPKSIALRSELIQRSHDAAINLKKGNLGLPIRNRSGSKDYLNDQTPLKGIPRSLNTSQFKMPTIANRLQIGAGRNPTRPSMPGVRNKDVGIKFLDQPVSLPDSKKKKKIQEQTESTNKANKEADKSNIEQTPTHYAAGLADYLPLLPPSPAVHSSAFNSENIQTQDRSIDNHNNEQPITSSSFQPSTLPTSIPHQLPPMPYSQPIIDTSSSLINRPITDQQQSLQSQHQQNLIQQQMQNQQSTVKKTVTTLTKSQADELRQISKNYPVGKNELSMIISFMSGNRQNPNPDDDIVRVKLGEKRELHRQNDGTYIQVINDGYYQMNYKTGESFQIVNKRIDSANINLQQPT